MGLDKYKKEDPERAEALLETLCRALAPTCVGDDHNGWWTIDDLRDELMQHKQWLMDVLRAVRGERD